MLRALSIVFALAAACLMVIAIAGMVNERQSDRTGWRLRAAAVLCFGIAVALNVVAH